MNINQTAALNLSEAIAPPTLRMAQDDANTRTIKASLWDGAQPFSIPSECVCMVRFGKPDGTGGLYDTTESGQKVSYSGNVVTAPVAAQMLAVAGIVKAQIDIYGGGEKQQAEKLATFRFRVEVEPSAYADAKIISSDYYNILSSQIAAAVEAGAKVDQAIQAAQQATEAASSASQSQTAAASSAQSASRSAQAASSAASSATSAKTAAESAQEAAQAAKESAASSASAAAQDAQSATQAAAAAMQDADDAEAWAVGKRNGADVPSTDPAYHNNAKYYKDQAQAVVGDKVDSFNGRTGAVVPQAGDYTAEMVGAQPLLTPGDNISITNNTIATKAFPCNPNLLDNWYFANPVNQRGQTSYTGEGYGIDRWYSLSSGLILTVSDGCIMISNTEQGEGGTIAEKTEVKSTGSSVTMSVLLKNGALFVTSGVPTADANLVILKEGLYAGFRVSENNTLEALFYFSGGTVTQESIVAVKLELGSQQTLAHHDTDGNWVLNEIPKFGDQLAECQRYLVDITPTQKFNISYIGELSANGAIILITLPASMRTLPTFVGNASDIQIAAESVPGYYTPTSVSVIGSSSASATIRCDFAHDKSLGTLCDFRKASDGAKFFLSADL